jgi:hypothetical protein
MSQSFLVSSGGASIGATPVPPAEAKARLQRHMVVLQGLGFAELGALGNLSLSKPNVPKLTVLQKSGVLLPSNAGTFEPAPGSLVGIARRAEGNGFANVQGQVWVTANRANSGANTAGGPILTSGNASGKLAPTIPLDQAYWFAKEIILGDGTTVVLAAGVKSLVILAEKLTIGKNVTFTWERPVATPPPVPQKPATPGGYQQAVTTAAETGRQGVDGSRGPNGYDGQLAPEVEFWFLQSTGFPAIDLTGQDGFQGIKGGDGGIGGQGQQGHDSAAQFGKGCLRKDDHGGRGGNGGRAGDGGNGGNGGRGGRFSIFAPQALINAWFQQGITINLSGGSGGAGGWPGNPGDGGAGGMPGNHVDKICINNHSQPGGQGSNGPIGNPGNTGQKGESQSNALQFLGIAPIDFYQETAKPAIKSLYPTHAVAGDQVSINGERFSSTDKVMITGFDGKINVPCTSIYTADNLMTFTVPQSTGGFAFVQVVRANGMVSASKGTLLVCPKISDVFPKGKLKTGREAFISGSGFGKTGTVWMKGESIGSFTVINNNTVKFICKRPTNLEENMLGENCNLKVVNNEGIGPENYNHSNELPVVLDTFRMLVFGDSVVWGGGLFESQKHYSLAGDYITNKLGGIKVYKTVKAHHGAKIGVGDTTQKEALHGEVSTRWPTILQQVDSLKGIPDANDIDLVLVGGGANDLPITDVMMASDWENLPQELDRLTTRVKQYCYTDMIVLLQKIIGQFPNAKVILTGYFHIFSQQSDPGMVRAYLLSVIENAENFPSFPSNLVTTRLKMIQLSDKWVVESNAQLAAAAQYVNTLIPSTSKVYFVHPETDASHAAHAPNSILWEPTNLGLPTDPLWDTVRKGERSKSESRLKSETATLINMWTMTKGNSSYHPKPAGAQRIFDKMRPALDAQLAIRNVVMRTFTGKYLGFQTGYGSKVVGKVETIGVGEISQLWDLGGGKVAIQASNGKFFSAGSGGQVWIEASQLRIGDSETFQLVPQGGGMFTIQATGGRRLVALSNGSIQAMTNSDPLQDMFALE